MANDVGQLEVFRRCRRWNVGHDGYIAETSVWPLEMIVTQSRFQDMAQMALAELQQDRIGCYGHSMGSTHTWMVGPWEPRLKCLVGNCCLPIYEFILRQYVLYCFPNVIPGLYAYGDTPDIAALIAPREFHLNFGEIDSGCDGCEPVKTIARAYEQARAADKFT